MPQNNEDELGSENDPEAGSDDLERPKVLSSGETPVEPAHGVDWELPNVADLTDIELQGVLRHLHRSTRKGRERAAADIATRSYLQAGLRLLSEAVSARHAPPDEDPISHPFVAWLSRRLIVQEMGNETDAKLPMKGSVNGLRDRWEPHSDYITDLLLASAVHG